MNLEERLSWKQKALRIAASFAIALGSARIAKANEADHLPITQNQTKTLVADINNDGVVDYEDHRVVFSQYKNKDKEPWYQENTVEVYTGQELTDPNTIYVLQNNIKVSGNCFTSRIGEVTINLNGYNIEGDGTGEAIVFYNESGIENVFIGNGTIKNFSSAINLKGANNSMLQGLDVSDNKGDYSTILENCPNILLSKIKCMNNDKSGLLMKNCYGNNMITDSTFSNNTLFDIKLVNSKENRVLNCDYDPDKESVANSSLIRKSSYRAYVQDSSGPVFNAKVSAYDARDDLEGMVRTGANGYTPSIWLTNYINEDGTIIPYGPHTITAEKGPFTDSHIYDPNVFNLEDIFTFGETDNGASERVNETESNSENPIKTLEGDLNNDGIVDAWDLNIMNIEWFQEEPWYQENKIPVHVCQELTEPAIYVLQNDIKTSGNCFTSRIGEVILKLSYWTIEGDGTGEGVVFYNESEDIKNISIRYGDIRNFISAINLKGVNNSILDHLHLSVSGNEGNHAIILENCSNISLSEAQCYHSGLFMKDCYGNNKITDSSFQRPIELINSKETLFLNCYPIWEESVDENSSLVRANSYRAYVQDSSGNPVFNAKVSAYDVEGNIESTVVTEPNGYTPSIWMINYINEAGTIIPYGPYTITAEKGPLIDSHIFDPDVRNQGEDSFTLK